jgi:cytoskeleton protein RodZ
MKGRADRLPPFGDKLKKAREKRSITLEDIALTTKIGTRFLRALEEDHFEQLPGGIFNRGFVRAYARCVGLDEDQTIADYLIASGEAQPKKAEVVEPVPAQASKAPVPVVVARKEVLAEKVDQPEDETSNFPWAIAASIVAFVLLGLAVWHFFARGPVRSGANASASSTTTRTPAPGAPSSAPATPAATSTAANSAPAGGSFVVLIKAAEESWISIKADDKPAFEVTLEEAGQQSIEAHNKIEVKVGNLGGVDFWFNGNKVPLQAEEGEVRSLTFDSSGLRPQLPKPESADTSVTSQ